MELPKNAVEKSKKTLVQKPRFWILQALLERLVCHVRAVVLLPTRDLALQALCRYCFFGLNLQNHFSRGLCVPVHCPLSMVEFVVTTLSLAFLCITWQSGKSIDAKQTRIPGESAPKICMIELMDQILPIRPISCNNLHTHICRYDI